MKILLMSIENHKIILNIIKFLHIQSVTAYMSVYFINVQHAPVLLVFRR
jgi:hypothetical protein